MHGARTDLYLNRLTVQYQRRVETLVSIGFGKGNVILDAGRDGLKPRQMLHQPQHVITKPHTPIRLVFIVFVVVDIVILLLRWR